MERMRRTHVRHMNGGNGEISYANNSSIQEKVILTAKPLIEKAISQLFCNLRPRRISVADMGCASGPNALLVSSEIIQAIHNTSKRQSQESPEVQIFLNDLPENDYNNLFRCLSQFQESLRKDYNESSGFPHCYFTGVPGSFYDRCFPTNSLHFIHSSYSLHWLSQVPRGLEGNKGNIYMSSTSPIGVLNSYHNQFKNDFSSFLKNRSLEVVTGGHMVLTMLGRNSKDRSSKEGCLTWGLLASALNDMVSEGIIEEEKLDSFHIPMYTPSPTEIALLVEEEGSFTINHLGSFEIHWSNASKNEHSANESTINNDDDDDDDDDASNLMNAVRSVAEPMLLDHFHEDVIEEIFIRFQKKICDCMATQRTVYINVVVSMEKRIK